MNTLAIDVKKFATAAFAVAVATLVLATGASFVQADASVSTTQAQTQQDGSFDFTSEKGFSLDSLEISTSINSSGDVTFEVDAPRELESQTGNTDNFALVLDYDGDSTSDAQVIYNGQPNANGNWEYADPVTGPKTALPANIDASSSGKVYEITIPSSYFTASSYKFAMQMILDDEGSDEIEGNNQLTIFAPEDVETIFSGNSDDFIEDEFPETSSIRVCKALLDADGNITAGADAAADFSIGLTGPGEFSTTTSFSTALQYDNNFFDFDDGDEPNDDTECVVYDGLEAGDYNYTPESIDSEAGFQTALYNDGVNEEEDSKDDFYEFGSEEGDWISDGNINLDADETRTLVILNQMASSTDPEGGEGDGEETEVGEQCQPTLTVSLFPEGGEGTDEVVTEINLNSETLVSGSSTELFISGDTSANATTTGADAGSARIERTGDGFNFVFNGEGSQDPVLEIGGFFSFENVATSSISVTEMTGDAAIEDNDSISVATSSGDVGFNLFTSTASDGFTVSGLSSDCKEPSNDGGGGGGGAQLESNDGGDDDDGEVAGDQDESDDGGGEVLGDSDEAGPTNEEIQELIDQARAALASLIEQLQGNVAGDQTGFPDTGDGSLSLSATILN